MYQKNLQNARLQRLTDLELVQNVQFGDKHAFDELVRRYHEKVVTLSNRYVSDKSEALDLTQEVFIKVYTALAQFRSESRFYTWLYRITINTAKNYVILKNRRPVTSDVDFDTTEKQLGKNFIKRK